MLKSERQNEIIKMLDNEGFMSVQRLAERLYASESSIRRDLKALEGVGIIKRSHGGAECITSASHILPFDRRSFDCAKEKREIAKKALSLIKEGDTVFLDQSSTAYFLASEIKTKKDITVVTNNIEIARLLSDSAITVYCTGGLVSKSNTNCLLGGMAQSGFSHFYADILFFSANSVTANGVICDCSQEEVFTRAQMLKNAKRKVFLCNSKKIGASAPSVQCTLADVDAVICESDAFVRFKDAFPTIEIIY